MCLNLVTISYVSMSFLKPSLACKIVFFFSKMRASKQSSWLVHILSWLWCLSNILLNSQSGPIQLRFPCLAIFINFTIVFFVESLSPLIVAWFFWILWMLWKVEDLYPLFPAVNVSLSMSANTVIACPNPHPTHIYFLISFLSKREERPQFASQI